MLKAEDPDAKWAEVNVMKIGTFGTATTPVKRRVEVKDGVLDWKSAGLSLAVVFERYGKNGNVGYGLVEGALTKPGAVATTWSHDSHNLFVLGTDENDMKLAQRRVLELQGAYVVFAGGKSLAEARLTIGGIVSDQRSSPRTGTERSAGGDGRSWICGQQRDHVYVHALSSGVSEVKAHGSRAFDGAGAGTCAVG
mgnify:CR=1 FL=1